MARVEPMTLARSGREAEASPDPQRYRSRGRYGNRRGGGYRGSYGGNQGINTNQLLALKVGVVKGLVLANILNSAFNGK